jgi:hypothetical protein
VVCLDGILTHLLREIFLAVEKANRPPPPAHSVHCPTIHFSKLINGIHVLKEDKEWSALFDRVIIPGEQW